MIEVCQNIKKEDRRRQKKTEKDRRKIEEDRKIHSTLSKYCIWYFIMIGNLYIVFTSEDRRRQQADRKRQNQQKSECNACFISKFNKDGRRYGRPY